MLTNVVGFFRGENMAKIHESVTQERVVEMVELDHNGGFCIACGEEAFCVEPDARRYTCESCDAKAVYGAEELLFMIG